MKEYKTISVYGRSVPADIQKILNNLSNEGYRLTQVVPAWHEKTSSADILHAPLYILEREVPGATPYRSSGSNE